MLSTENAIINNIAFRRMQPQAQIPEYRIVILNASSFVVYQHDSMKNASRGGSQLICGNNWKEGRFSDTYTELHGYKTAETSRPGYRYEDAGPDADPEGHIQRWPDFGQDQVAGDLHEDVASTALLFRFSCRGFETQDERNAEDQYGDTEIITLQVKILFERVESCLSGIYRISVVL